MGEGYASLIMPARDVERAVENVGFTKGGGVCNSLWINGTGWLTIETMMGTVEPIATSGGLLPIRCKKIVSFGDITEAWGLFN